MKTPAVTRAVVWFRNDLRLHDNPILHRAASATEVVPVFCFDPRHYGRTPFGSAKTGALRARFQLESVLNLRESLRSIGSDLYVAYGQPEAVLPLFVSPTDPKGTSILCQEHGASEELAVRERPSNDGTD